MVNNRMGWAHFFRDVVEAIKNQLDQIKTIRPIDIRVKIAHALRLGWNFFYRWLRWQPLITKAHSYRKIRLYLDLVKPGRVIEITVIWPLWHSDWDETHPLFKRWTDWCLKQDEESAELYIDAFFYSLDWRRKRRCEIALAGIKAIAARQPKYRYWYRYLSGIKTNDLDSDWPKAEAIFTELLAGDFDDLYKRGKVLLARGRTYEYLGNWTDALTDYEASLAIFNQAAEPVDQVKALKQIANIWYCKFNQREVGEAALQRELQNCHQALMLIEPLIASDKGALDEKGRVLNTMGLLYFSLNELDKALDCYRQELEIVKTLKDSLGQALTYGNIGEVQQRKKRYLNAERNFKLALTELQRLDEFTDELEVRANLGYLYRNWADHDQQALEAYEQAIALVERRLQKVSHEKHRITLFAMAEEIYANIILLLQKMGQPAQAFDYVERARSRTLLYTLSNLKLLVSEPQQEDVTKKQETSLDILSLLRQRFSALKKFWSPPSLSQLLQEGEVKPMTLREVQATLPSEALLLEYFITDLEASRLSEAAKKTGIRRHRSPEAKLFLFAVTRDHIEFYDIDYSLIKFLRDILLSSDVSNLIEKYILPLNVRQSLYQHLIRPVEMLLQNKQHLFLVPHNLLHYISFQALVAADGDTLLRQEGPKIIYSPSATILFHRRQKLSEQSVAACLAVGYNGAGLKVAEDEAHNVARLMGGRSLVGNLPEKVTIFREAANHKILHFSCHGYFDSGDFSKSHLEIAPNEVLAVQDIFENKLRLKCHLVTLSACNSGMNQIRPGDELGGFIPAFMVAGAPVLMSPLWQVEECSTWLLMDHFYKGIQGSLDFATALKQAQLHLKNLTYKDLKEIQKRSAGHKIYEAISTKLSELPDWVEMDEDKPFADPRDWGAFILVGHYNAYL